MQRQMKLDESGIRKTMGAENADIEMVSVAFASFDDPYITLKNLHQDQKHDNDISKETFGAASLSKPVFAYLALKLAQAGILDLKTPIEKWLPFEKFAEDFCKQNNCIWRKTINDDQWVKLIIAKLVFSHQTGLDVFNGVLDIRFKPGTGFRYSGVPLMYLQRAIEAHTGKTLEELAQQYVFEPLKMTHSSFTTNAISANSLQTTAEDYARFMQAWVTDPALQFAFDPAIHMLKEGKCFDQWAQDLKVPTQTLEHLAAGLGWDLEKDNNGKVIRAYKTGDMDCWRGMAAIDFEKRTLMVFFAKSPNGHVLADQIISENITLKHGFDAFFKKFGFTRKLEEDWQQAEKNRMAEIVKYLKSKQEQTLNQDQNLSGMFVSKSEQPETMKKNSEPPSHEAQEWKKK